MQWRLHKWQREASGGGEACVREGPELAVWRVCPGESRKQKERQTCPGAVRRAPCGRSRVGDAAGFVPF